MIKAFSQKIPQSLRNLVNNHCVACRCLSKTLLCESCLNQLQKPQKTCCRCATLLIAETQTNTCLSCLKSPPAFDVIDYILPYEQWLSRLLVAAKVGRQVEAIAALRYLVRIKASSLRQIGTPALLPVPSPKSRLMTRGFNLSAVLADEFARQLNLKILPPTAVVLPFYVPKQAKLSWQKRQKNRHHYQIKAQLPENILIIDDIVTTGATVNELAKTLKENSVKTVAVWAISRVFEH